MSEDNRDKHNALEEFLEDALNEADDATVGANIPDQEYKSSSATQTKSSHKEDQDENTSNKSKQRKAKPEPQVEEDIDDETLIERLSGLTSSAFNFAKRTTQTSFKVGKALIHSQDQLKLMLAAGQSLKDLREVAGLTLSEANEALNLKDKSILEAVENGTATLSFELILRLSALLARNDPIPFIIKYTRTYNPEIWKILSDWGLGRIPLQYERERQFINIFRAHDEARKLSDDGYKKVLEFTQKAFDMSLHFIAEQENVPFEETDEKNENTVKPNKGDDKKSEKNKRPDK
ncbi:helix-turn-helix domain-containing protein [Alkalimarinus sediminis]|uniref:Helix-turn-helix domain-containing protein n=1 Tax=Alkalimarinus sediminis TaxID=1632866 RepID=A0A9E8KRY1_9ALTE|nr:helix-turn-helix transcriptional regulator [Alkalimarinus sediminis]UZW76702.1 helix-turn-helix domain-containing protein [Alkalimarinus sediminis]